MDTDEDAYPYFYNCDDHTHSFRAHLHPDSGDVYVRREFNRAGPLRPGATGVRGRDVGSGNAEPCRVPNCKFTKLHIHTEADRVVDAVLYAVYAPRKPDADRTNDRRTAKADDRKCIGHALGYLASPFASGHKYATITFEPCGYCGTK